MPITTVHSDYARRLSDWRMVRDFVDGEAAVRANVLQYLPPPPGMVPAGSPRGLNEVKRGQDPQTQRYAHYAGFAEFVEILGPTLDALQGLIHDPEQPPQVEIPDKYAYLLSTASRDGSSLQSLWEAVTRAVFHVGRVALLLEVNDQSDQLEFCLYQAESLRNWKLGPKRDGGGPETVVLREVQQVVAEDDPYSHAPVPRYRELAMLPDGYAVRTWMPKDSGNDGPEDEWEFEVQQVDGADEDGWIYPDLQGTRFGSIPMVVGGPSGVGWAADRVPAKPLAQRVASIFRRTADLNRSLFIKGDPQPVLWGVDPDKVPSTIGGSKIWGFSNPDGKAEYLDIQGDGIPHQKEAIESDYARFYLEAGRLLRAEDSRAAESGEALRRRLGAQQVTAKSITVQCGKLMQFALRMLVSASGGDEEAVEATKFVPATNFSEPSMSAEELLQLIEAQNLGAPLSTASLHELMQRRGMTRKTLEEEAEAMREGPQFGAGSDQQGDLRQLSQRLTDLSRRVEQLEPAG